jgi:hypothetical protein
MPEMANDPEKSCAQVRSEDLRPFGPSRQHQRTQNASLLVDWKSCNRSKIISTGQFHRAIRSRRAAASLLKRC